MSLRYYIKKYFIWPVLHTYIYIPYNKKTAKGIISLCQIRCYMQ